MVYITEVIDRRVGLAYYFHEGKLVSATYIFLEEHQRDFAYINDYRKIRGLLSDKYGPPIANDIIWLNTSHKGNIGKYPLALSNGDLIFASFWVTEKTKISYHYLGMKKGLTIVSDIDISTSMQPMRSIINFLVSFKQGFNLCDISS